MTTPAAGPVRRTGRDTRARQGGCPLDEESAVRFSSAGHDPMIVLGVDAGSLSTGYGVVEAVGTRQRALAFGAIRNAPDRSHPERLALIHSQLLEVIDRFRPTVLALEEAFVARNAQSALKLGQVRGAVMVAAMAKGLEVMEFTPAEVKAAVTGHGRAEKAQVQLMVKALLGLARPPEPHDAADALAVAICALGRSAWRRKVGGA